MCDPSGIGDLIESASDGSSFLVSGPAMTGKYDLFVRLLAGGNAIAVSTDTDADTLRADYGELSDPAALSIVDCASRTRGVETPQSEDVQYVSGPGNLTRIGTAFTTLLDRHPDKGGCRPVPAIADPHGRSPVHSYNHPYEEPLRVGLHSISPLLMYAELRSVYRFLQVFTGQIQSAGGLCFATFDPLMHDERTANTVSDPFDARIETRMTEGKREARIIGLGPESSEWLAF